MNASFITITELRKYGAWELDNTICTLYIFICIRVAAVAVATAASRGAPAAYLEVTTGSNSVGRARGTTAAAAAAATNGTLFGFKDNFGSIRPRKAQQQIQFIH